LRPRRFDHAGNAYEVWLAILEYSISHFAGQKMQTLSVILQDRRAITKAGRPGTAPLLESDDVNGLLRRPHSSALSEAIPAFFVGRNKDGFWVARDADAKIGGIFLFERSALNFANRLTWPVRCAIIYPSEKFELDIENDGNRLLAYFGRQKHVVSHHARRVVAFLVRAVRRTNAH
jgi:hypothetical protein